MVLRAHRSKWAVVRIAHDFAARSIAVNRGELKPLLRSSAKQAHGSRWLGRAVRDGLSWLLAGACAVQDPQNGSPRAEQGPLCPVDQAREYACDELLPRRSSLPAPEPFANCPGSVDGDFGELEPRRRAIAFDPSYTRHTRLRLPPGNSCCYSWCSRVKLVDPSRVDPGARCREPLAMRETYCLDELESGTTQPSAPPYERCPRAIAPPPSVVFYAPSGALLDAFLTGERRQLGFAQCCYAWCSLAPPNSGLAGR